MHTFRRRAVHVAVLSLAFVVAGAGVGAGPGRRSGPAPRRCGGQCRWPAARRRPSRRPEPDPGRLSPVARARRGLDRRVARRGATQRSAWLQPPAVEQSADGLTVYGAYAKAAFDPAGNLVHLIDRLARVPAAGLAPARVSAQQALRTALDRLHPGAQAALRATATAGNTTVFEGGAFFHEAPTVTAVAAPMADGTLSRAWLVETWSEKKNLLHHTLVSGEGQVLHIELRTASDSYNVFPVDPRQPQQIVQGPGAGNAQSPDGWLAGRSEKDTNISGNNVSAYLDTDDNNRADAGGTRTRTGNFLASANLAAQPSTAVNKQVAVQNLFYLNNVVHDILYSHGFTESAGNFQVDNFGKGGAGNDSVKAEAQDGGGLDNANFATPPDGRKPRMQMYLFSGRCRRTRWPSAHR
jgi:hypothetical protein